MKKITNPHTPATGSEEDREPIVGPPIPGAWGYWCLAVALFLTYPLWRAR